VTGACTSVTREVRGGERTLWSELGVEVCVTGMWGWQVGRHDKVLMVQRERERAVLQRSGAGGC